MTVVFSYTGNESLAEKICEKTGFERGVIEWRNFPDHESYVRLISSVKDKEVAIVCTLNNPNEKIMSLLFFAKLAKENRVKKITLIAPYLSYMRQDKIFQKGEGVTAKYFADLISEFFDALITIDPHSHRLELNEIYSIPSHTIHAAPAIAEWLKKINEPLLLIGPDIESEQWIEPIAKKINQPYIIAKKKRISDQEVLLDLPDLTKHANHQTIIIDDIIASGGTLIALVKRLQGLGVKSPKCIVIHPVFSIETEKKIYNSGVSELVSCTTILHKTNKIEISQLIVDYILS